jgi:cytochrome c-type biogenesis protein CcmH/NrfG
MASTEAWRFFLEGRIADESKRFPEALEAYSRALQEDPNNVYFLRAKANVLLEISSNDEVVADEIGKAYGELAERLTGDADKPEAWISGIGGILEREAAPRERAARPPRAMVW